MPATIKFDRRGPSGIENDINQGLVITQGLQILDFPISNYPSRNSDPFVFLRALSMTGSGPGDYVNRFPQMLDMYPPPAVSGDPDFTFCTVFHQRIVGLDASKRLLEAEIKYRSPIGPQSEGVITYTRNQRTIQSWVKSSTTADGSQVISAWYQAGLAPPAAITHWIAPLNPNEELFENEPAKADNYTGWPQKMYTSRALEFIGQTTTANWNSVKATFNAAAGKINSDTEGVWAPRGKWMYLGPDVSTSNGGTIGSIVHRIVEATGVFGRWYPIIAYMNKNGIHPPDAMPEAALEVAIDTPGFPPPVGNQIRINGITMASNQLETAFASLFPTESP